MGLIERYEQGEPFGDLLAEADTKMLALENHGIELAAKLGETEHQLRGAVDLLREIADSGAVLVDDRLSWVEVQIDRETWGALVAYRSGGQ